MADENKDAAEFAEFEAKLPAQGSNKDIWLFLIIVDVVFLCVFGFFLYKNLSARLLAPETPVKPGAVPVVQEPQTPQTDAAEIPVVVPETVEEVPTVEPSAPVTPVPAEPVVQQTAPAPVQTPAADEKKESVSVKTNSKSKYRQVTFRYFGEAEKVAVVSGFTMAKPRALSKKNGVWEVTLSIAPGTYKYLFVVDGKQTPDPYAEQKDGRSLLVLK